MSAQNTQLLVYRIQDHDRQRPHEQQADLDESVETLARLQLAENILHKLIDGNGFTSFSHIGDRLFLESAADLTHEEWEYLGIAVS